MGRKRKAEDGGNSSGNPRPPKVKRGPPQQKAGGVGFLAREEDHMAYINDIYGLRHVVPYVHDFQVYAKGRWMGRTLLDVFVSEFAAETEEYYKAAILAGRVTIGGNAVPLDYRIMMGDVVGHAVHRHEMPVRCSAAGVQILAETDDVIVVNKPATLPVHPCGTYRHNSLVCLLHRMRPDLPELLLCHRLDRLTSGVVILAKHPAVAKELCEKLTGFQEGGKKVSKTYLARVSGDFGTNLPQDKKWAGEDGAVPTMMWSTVRAGDKEGNALEVEVSAPVEIESYKKSKYKCDPGGKPATSFIRRLVYDAVSNTSVVAVTPREGRTHQIRLHLQYLGHPIANDPVYGGSVWGGTVGGVNGSMASRAWSWLRAHGCDGGLSIVSHGGGDEEDEYGGEGNSNGAKSGEVDAETASKIHKELMAGPMVGESADSFMRRTCKVCAAEMAAVRTAKQAAERGLQDGIELPVPPEPTHSYMRSYIPPTIIATDISLNNTSNRTDMKSSTRDRSESIETTENSKSSISENAGGTTCVSEEQHTMDVVLEAESCVKTEHSIHAHESIDNSGSNHEQISHINEDHSNNSVNGILAGKVAPTRGSDAWWHELIRSLQSLTHSQGIWLHSLRYEAPEWKYETQIPEWARDVGLTDASLASFAPGIGQITPKAEDA